MKMKPFLSYIGSKSKFMDKIDEYLPDEINNYYEPFIGGGSVFFYVNEMYNINKNYINDLDKDLINLYKIVKSNDYKTLLKYLKELNEPTSKDKFDENVILFNKNSTSKIKKSAIYIFLNKKSFNGNLKYGLDNIIKPYFSKQKKNLKIYDKDNIIDIHNLLKKTNVSNKDYIKFLKEKALKKGDFVFLDPPYLVNGIEQYYKETFEKKNFEDLKNLCNYLDKKKVNFMLTVNKHSYLKDLFKDYYQTSFKKHSGMSGGKYNEYEMIITNY